MNKKIERAVRDRLADHERFFEGIEKPLLMISTGYPGLWLEHVYDSVLYARLDKSKLFLAENAIEAFMNFQTEDGQLPFVLWANGDPLMVAGYSQIQECLSFGSLALSVYEMNKDPQLLKRAYDSVLRWVGWLKRNRMTRGLGLVEMFFGYDTGHDNSPRALDLGCPENYLIDGTPQNASTLPEDDGITPIIPLDMNCNFYGNLKALERMAELLGIDGSAFRDEAKEVKQKIFDICFDAEDCFFYDVDRQGNKRKIKSCQIFSLFTEGVLDKEEDAALIERLCGRYIFNENHFFTPYPFPAISVSDPAWKKYTDKNCWGYYTQSLTVLRCTLWMEKYGFTKEFDTVCQRFTSAWERCFDTVKLGQELDPITGIPTDCSEWYSAGMVMYLYCAKRSEDLLQ